MTRKRIAIIGTGISGMAAAYMLHAHADVTVFEKTARIGGHTRTLTVNYNGVRIPVDTGFIVLNNRNYPGLLALFRHLGVEIRKSDMSFAASLDNGKTEWSSRALMSSRALSRPDWWLGVADILRFNRDARRVAAQRPTLSLAELLDMMHMGEWFRQQYILPMAAAIWSCPAEQMMQFPAKSFVTFFDHHGLLTVLRQPQWYTVVGGSQTYVDKITARYTDKIALNNAATRVTRSDDKVQVTTQDGAAHEFDEVVFACHGDEALSILVDADENEKSALSAFTYQKNTAYLNRDQSHMPRNRKHWSSWNYLSNGPNRHCNVTYWMNNLQGIDARYPLFLTLNPERPIAADKIFDVHEFTHPIFTADAIAAQPKISALQGRRGTWFCGAHLGYGFHEDGLQSAIRVVRQMGIPISWL